MKDEKIKKKIIHVLNSNQYSGAENVAVNIIQSLSSDFEFAYACPQGPIEEKLKKMNIEYLPIDKCTALNIKQVAARWNADIIHAHDFRASIHSSLSMSSCKIISHIHQNPDWLGKINKNSLMFSLALSRVAAMISVDQAINENYIFEKKIRKKSFVLPNIINKDRVISLANSTNGETFDFVFFGRLADVKDPLKFIRIIKKIHDLNPLVTAAIVGDGPLKQACIREINKLGLEDSITMCGFLDNPFPIINSSKIFIMTSKTEGLPMSLLEALVLGKPVLVPPISSFDRIIDRTCGAICMEDESYVLNGMRLLENEEYYYQISNGSKLRGNELSNESEYYGILNKIYNSL